MKVVFLDMDGVVNSARWFSIISKRAARRAKGAAKAAAMTEHERLVEMIDPAAVSCLNRIADRTGVVFVLSSSWRIPWSVKTVEAALRARGFTGRLVDRTPSGLPTPSEWVGKDYSIYGRGVEITDWLSRHPEVERFVILDDSADMAHLLPHLVRTSWARGIEDEHVEAAVRMLCGAESVAGRFA